MSHDDQVLYNGRWVKKEHFRTFIYNESGQKLVNSWIEYESEIGTGEWFSRPEEVIQPKAPVSLKTGRKAKDASANSKGISD